MTVCFRCLVLLFSFAAVQVQPAASAGTLRISSVDANHNFPKELLDRFAAAHDVDVVVVPWKPFETIDYLHGTNRPDPAPIDVLTVGDGRLEQMIRSGLLLWDALGIEVARTTHDGPIDSSALLFDPPPNTDWPLQIGRSEIVHMALQYLGHDPCKPGQEGLDEVTKLLTSLKPRTVEGNFQTDFDNDGRGLEWRSFFLEMRRRADGDWHVEGFDFGLPKEGFPIEGYHAVALRTTPNPDNARLFQEFLMLPENAALVSEYSLSPSPIVGASELLPEDIRELIAVDPERVEIGYRGRTCSYDLHADVLYRLTD